MNSHPDWRTAVFAGQLHADRFKVERLLELAREGKLRVPPFQRPLRWRRDQEADLFDSVLRRFPVGTLLLWERPAHAEVVRFKDFATDSPDWSSAYWIVDGQQRVNTLVGLLLRPAARGPTRRPELHFDLRDGKFLWRRDEEDVRFLPVRRLANVVEVTRWARATRADDAAHDLAVQVASAILNYEVPAYTTTVADDQVLREVFARVNTHGSTMREREVFQALNRRDEQGLPFDEPLNVVALEAGFGPVSEATRMKILQAVAEISPRSGAVLNQKVDALVPMVPAAAEALHRAVLLLRDEAEIPGAALLPGDLPLIVLSHLFHRFPDVCERSTVLLRRWIWRSAAAGALSLTNEHLHRAFRDVQQARGEEDAVQALLQSAPGQAPRELPTPSQVNRRGATTRLGLLWLHAQAPGAWSAAAYADALAGDASAVDPPDADAPSDELSAFETGDAAPIEPREPGWSRLPCADPKLQRLIGTVVLRDDLDADALRALAEAPADTLRQLAFTDDDRDELSAGAWDALASRRTARIQAGVVAMIRRHAEWSVDDDGPSIEHTLRGDDEP
jgi:hypothetical protein